MTWNFLANRNKKQDQRFASVSTLVVKVTHRCNLDCSYCYENITRKGQDMELETFQSLCDAVFGNSHAPEITFLFHGGEPLLLATEWYSKAMDYAQGKAREYGKSITFSMQTNLLSLSESKISLLKKYSIHPGISLDNSIYALESARGKEEVVFRNFKRLKSEGISCGILSTINHLNYHRFDEVCRFLEKEAGVKKFKANVVLPVGRAWGQTSLLSDQVHQAEISILEYMIQSEGRLMETNLLLELERFFEYDKGAGKSLCHKKTCGAGTRVMGITPDGNILPCGRFAWNDHDYFLGSIENENLDYSDKLNSFMSLAPENWQHCSSCKARKICRFGCQAFIVRSKEKLNVECLPTQLRFEYFEKNQHRLETFMKLIKHKSIDQSEVLFTFSSKGVLKK